MNAWAVVYLIWFTVGATSIVYRVFIEQKNYIEVTVWNAVFSPAVTIFILYMAGLFS